MTKKKGEPPRSAFHLQSVPNSQTGNDYALKIERFFTSLTPYITQQSMRQFEVTRL
jgi:hypothetical protein